MTRVVAAARAAAPREPSATQAAGPRQSRGVASIDEAITRFLAKLQSEPVPEASAALASPAANAPTPQPQTPWLLAVVVDEPAPQDASTQPQGQDAADAREQGAAQTSSSLGSAATRPEGADTGVFPTLGGAPLEADATTEESVAGAATKAPAPSGLEEEMPPGPALSTQAGDMTATGDDEAAQDDASAASEPESDARHARTARERGGHEGGGDHSGSSEDRGHRRVTASFERARDSTPPPKASDPSAQSASLPKSEATRTLSGVGAGVPVVSLPVAPVDTPASPLATAGEVDAAGIADELEPEVTEALSRLRSLGEGRATVRLEHPSLGSIRVDLSLDGDAVDVRLVAATSSAAIALRESERALRDAFGSRAARLRYRVSTRGPDQNDLADDSSSAQG